MPHVNHRRETHKQVRRWNMPGSWASHHWWTSGEEKEHVGRERADRRTRLKKLLLDPDLADEMIFPDKIELTDIWYYD